MGLGADFALDDQGVWRLNSALRKSYRGLPFVGGAGVVIYAGFSGVYSDEVDVRSLSSHAGKFQGEDCLGKLGRRKKLQSWH